MGQNTSDKILCKDARSRQIASIQRTMQRRPAALRVRQIDIDRRMAQQYAHVVEGVQTRRAGKMEGCPSEPVSLVHVQRRRRQRLRPRARSATPRARAGCTTAGLGPVGVQQALERLLVAMVKVGMELGHALVLGPT